MGGLAAVTLDGVLRSEVGGAPIPEGVALYQALVEQYRLCIVLDENDTAAAALWLRKENLRGYAQLHVRRPLDDRLMQYKRLMALGPVEIVVDGDPTAVAGALELGLTALLFAHPRAHRPEWRPDYERAPKPWDELVARVEETRAVGDEPPPVE